MENFLNNFSDLWMDSLYFICNLLFGWINLPSFPVELTTSINSFLNLIFDNLSLLGLIIRPTTFYLVIPLLVILINFETMYKVTMWIIKKIPFVNIK